MQVKIDPDAFAELAQVTDWYSKRSEEAALRFVAEVDVAFEKITLDPQRFLHTYASCQCCSLHHFPYTIVYYCDGETIHIMAIAHAKRKPGYWKARLS